MRILRWTGYGLAILLGTVLGLVVFAAAVLAVIFQTSLPGMSGEVRVAGLGGEVTVVRDENAVPHIFADSLPDAYRALGYVHAQDRLFQMEFARRLAQGRMAEAVGGPALRSDRFVRTLGIASLTEATVRAMSPETRAAVDAYVEGVNAWLTSPDFVRPPELIVLGIDPKPWTAADSAAWGRLMALWLSGNWRDELTRARVAALLPAERLGDLWPEEPADAPVTVAGLGRDILTRLAGEIPDIWLPGSASNEWAVGPERSTTGAALLANDPHLGLAAPGMWHLARIVTPEITLSGAALPGQPFFMVGQNGHVAWGLTTTHADTQDLFVERIDPQDPSRYLAPGGPRPFETREETIPVRWSDPETITVRTTRHGPVVSDLGAGAGDVAKEGEVLSLAFAGLSPEDRTPDAIHAMNMARDAAGVREALRGFHSPMQNIAFADTAGAVGFVASGLLPVRPRGDGSLPAEGWSGADDWAGFVGFEDLPQRDVPADGTLVNANNRVVADDYPYTVSSDWPESYRAERIESMLAGRMRHAPEDFAAMQQDILSLPGRDLTPRLLALLAPEEAESPAARLMAGWDGRMSRESPQPLIFTAWLMKLSPALVGDELGPLGEEFDGLRPRMVAHMLEDAPDWCDDTTTGDTTESCSDTVTRAWREAIALLSGDFGDDPESWTWGDAHRARFAHQIWSRIPVLRTLIGADLATDGGAFTVNRASPSTGGRGALFSNVHGAGLRAVFDMADPDAARYIVAPGQSGYPASPFYANLAEPWREGRYLTLNRARGALEAEATGVLTLRP